jgi:hypothetical protein
MFIRSDIKSGLIDIQIIINVTNLSTLLFPFSQTSANWPRFLPNSCIKRSIFKPFHQSDSFCCLKLGGRPAREEIVDEAGWLTDCEPELMTWTNRVNSALLSHSLSLSSFSDYGRDTTGRQPWEIASAKRRGLFFFLSSHEITLKEQRSLVIDAFF